MADSGTVAVTFYIECTQTKPGEAVFIVGSSTELGAWKPEDAVPCATTAKVFPNWTSEKILLPASVGKVEFKVLVMKADCSKPGAARWEGGANRALVMPKTNGGQVQLGASLSWGLPEVTYRTKTDESAGGGGASSSSRTRTGSGSGPMARVETGVHFAIDETGDGIADLKPITSFNRLRSGTLGMPRTSSAHDGMQRRSSRHLCIGGDGMLNTEMSRTPSLMLIDEMQLEQDCKVYEEKVAKLERDKLNQMQRRMPSGSLLESMKEIIESADKNKTVMLQGFNWESWRAGGGDWYSVIGKKVELLTNLGITDVWLPPPSQSVAPQGYLPSQLFNLDGSKYGTQASLQSLIKSMHDAGIRAVADIVVNHRCGDQQDSQGRWNQFTSGMTARPSFAGVMDWGGWAITLGDKFSDGTGEHAPGKYDGKFDAAPDIDHANKKVQQSISIWLRWLQLEIGFDAWRFDFVKGYSAEFVGLYCKKSAPAWAVGELWGDMQYDDNGLCHNQDRHRQDLVNWINATDKQSTAFDFTTKGILQEAVRNCQYWRLKDKDGKPPGLIGWMPKHAVTFIDNHDTGSTQRHWPFPDDKVLVGYAYIITHPGIPSLFWDHVMDWGEHHRNQIGELLRVRRESGIPVDAPVKIQCADQDLYIAEIGSPPALRVALGPRHPGDPDGNYWKNGPAGPQFRVWIHKESPPAPAPAPAPKESPKSAMKKNSPKDAPPALPAFNPITVDGTKLTPEALQGMSKKDLEALVGKIDPVVQAAKKAAASK
mmetsp:Transcript_120077/g.299536  ORF Transcript_120077/g.299536 Transcript_120077/m.299536 type:complete len:767 (-) Transcript_120077:206-2506(-)